MGGSRRAAAAPVSGDWLPLLWGRLALSASLIAVSALGTSFTPAYAADPLEPATFEQIDAFLTDEMAELGIPGMAVVVVQGDEVVHVGAFGVADDSGRPVTTDTPFQLASVSKAFTATAVMQLVEAGRIELDAPVQRYMPWFRIADEDASARITIRHLLHHTAGFTRALASDDDQDAGSLERYVRALAAAPLISEPGAEHHYTNATYNVLGLVVQTVAGVPFDEYVSEHIFEPLGMTHSHVLPAAARADGASEGFYRWFGVSTQPTRFRQSRSEGPSALVHSSANDLGRWLIANLNEGTTGDGRILSPAGMATLHTPAVEVDEVHGYGMGWVVRPYWEAVEPTSDELTAAFPLPALIEHDGVYDNAHAYIGLVPERDFGFVVMMNLYDRSVGSRFGHVEQGLLRILAGHEPLPVHIREDVFDRYAKQLGVVLFVVLLISLAWSIRTIRRWSRRTDPPRPLTAAIAVGAPLLLDLFVLWLVLGYATGYYDTSIQGILSAAPDVALVVVPGLVLAGVWGPIRSVVYLVLLVRRRRRATGTVAAT